MKSIVGGALALVIVQVLISSSLTAGRLGGLAADLSTVVSRFVDPTVPLIGTTATSAAATTPTTTTATTVAAPTYSGSGVGALTTYSQY